MTALAEAPTTSATKVEFGAQQLIGAATAPPPVLLGSSMARLHISGAVQRSTPLVGRPSFKIKVALEDGLWMVTDQPTGIYGCGETVQEALTDFKQATRDHLDVLQRQPTLAEPLRRQLRYLLTRVA